MNKLARNLGASAIAVSLFAIAQSVHATEITCENTTDYRYVTLSDIVGGVSCGPTSNTDTTAKNENDFFTNYSAYQGYELLHKINANNDGSYGLIEGSTQNLISQITGLASSSGSISLAPNITDAILTFKFGNNDEPDWIGFALDGMTFANWAVLPSNAGGQSLSHVSLWGKSITQVPEPGTLALFGLGIAGLILARRKNRSH